MGIPNHDETVALTPTQIQEMINTFVASAFTSMRISGLSLPPTAPAFHSSTALSASISPSTWLLDSSASKDMTSVEQNIQDSQTYVGHESITTANGQQMSITGMGSIMLSTPHIDSLTLSNVYFVPQSSANLVSVAQLFYCGLSC